MNCFNKMGSVDLHSPQTTSVYKFYKSMSPIYIQLYNVNFYKSKEVNMTCNSWKGFKVHIIFYYMLNYFNIWLSHTYIVPEKFILTVCVYFFSFVDCKVEYYSTRKRWQISVSWNSISDVSTTPAKHHKKS